MRANRREMMAYRFGWIVRSAWRWFYALAGLALFCGVCWCLGEMVQLIGKVV